MLSYWSMHPNKFLTTIGILVLPFLSHNNLFSQTTDIVILGDEEIQRLYDLKANNIQFSQLCDSISTLGINALNADPRPLKEIHYEGLLETNPKRIDTRKSLQDMDHVVNLVYSSYLHSDINLRLKAVEIVDAWARTYNPTGNTINENKLVPLFWAYYLFRKSFSKEQQNRIETWISNVAKAQINRPSTPNNNWQAKRLKIIGLAGIITENEEMIQFAANGFRKYIDTAYYSDGTSYDLKQRDALHYHVSGIRPCLAAFVNFSRIEPEFDLFNYAGKLGGSIRKSVDYVVPFASGEREREEWVNTKVELDRQRAAAGLSEYQPGMLFQPEKSKGMFEWAVYFDDSYLELVDKLNDGKRSWIAFLNSPDIRR